jgi:diguanylate cyclase (GGDEF)-like protein
VTSQSEGVRQALARAWRLHIEDPASALTTAVECHEIARSLEDPALCARARALQGAVSLHRGDLSGALDLLFDAERYRERGEEDVAARAEVAVLKAQVSFFTGSYTEAVGHAERAVALADQSGDPELRISARRGTCMVLGNIGVADLGERIKELLELTRASGHRWEEAISLNDLAVYFQESGDLCAAEREIDRALEVAGTIESQNRFALGVIHSTRADIRLLAGRAEEALADAKRAISLLTERGDPNPYVLAATVRAEVQARMAIGAFDDARQSGEDILAWLGDRLPHTRSLILSTLASALREAGRVEEAYDALARAAELERQAFRELSELQLRLERATLETTAARRESEALAAKNRELSHAHAELEHRASELERLQAQLRDQAERDWLTGLHNRRYLASELQRLTEEEIPVPVSVAVLDLDHFKSINDGFGHVIGDRVLVRVAGLLCDTLRASDIVVRSGGEEFVIVMPMTDARAAGACCQRIRQAIHDEAWEQLADGLTVTASVGVGTTHDLSALEPLVHLADRRLYSAKEAGRDMIVDA